MMTNLPNEGCETRSQSHPRVYLRRTGDGESVWDSSTSSSDLPSEVELLWVQQQRRGLQEHGRRSPRLHPLVHGEGHQHQQHQATLTVPASPPQIGLLRPSDLRRHPYAHPRRRLTINRLILRPFAVLVFGLCALQLCYHERKQAWQRRLEGQRAHAKLPDRLSGSASRGIDFALDWDWDASPSEAIQETIRTLAAGFGRSLSSSSSWTASIGKKQQQAVPMYPAVAWTRSIDQKKGQLQQQEEDVRSQTVPRSEHVEDCSGELPGLDISAASSGDVGNDPLSRENKNKSQTPAASGDTDRNTKSPQLYGWEPTVYPDPILDPVRCGISYLPEIITRNYLPSQDTDQDAHDRYNYDVYNPYYGFGVGANPDADSNAAEWSVLNTNASASPLRLCDPDWVLGGVYLEEIALALNNFSNLYSHPTSPAIDGGDIDRVDDRNDNDDELSDWVRRGLRHTAADAYYQRVRRGHSSVDADLGLWASASRSLAKTPLADNDPSEQDGSDMVGMDGPAPEDDYPGRHVSTRLDVEAASSDSDTAESAPRRIPIGDDETGNKTLRATLAMQHGPVVELAVATVRKVRPLLEGHRPHLLLSFPLNFWNFGSSSRCNCLLWFVVTGPKNSCSCSD